MRSSTDGCFAAVVAIVIGIPLASFLYAWAAELNWNWFASSILGVPRVGFWQVYGLSLVVSSFTSSSSNSKTEDADIGNLIVKMFATIFVRFAILAGSGWV